MIAASGAGAALARALAGALAATLAGLRPWLVALPAAALVLLGAALAALALAAVEWLLWRVALRTRLPLAAPGSLIDWVGGLAGLPHPTAARGEPLGVAVGFATVLGGVIFAAAVLAGRFAGRALPGAAGVLALFPLACALGYAMTAERARTPEAARTRMRAAARILLGAPPWVLAVALWAHAATAPWLLAAALVWSGLFVLPGAVAETGLAARPWGGDPHEESGAVRLLTGAAHYLALAVVCALAGVALAGGGAPLPTAIALAAVAALVLRGAATLPVAGSWVRRAPEWMVPALVLLALLLPRAAGAARVAGLP